MRNKCFVCTRELYLFGDDFDDGEKVTLLLKAEVVARNHEEAELFAEDEFVKARLEDRFLDYGMDISFSDEWDIRP